MNLRYAFLKRKYHDHLVLIAKRGRYRSYCDDKDMFEYILYLYRSEKKNKKKLKTEDEEFEDLSSKKYTLLDFIRSLGINYVLLGINNDVKVYEEDDNKYDLIKYKAFTYKILREVRNGIESKG